MVKGESEQEFDQRLSYRTLRVALGVLGFLLPLLLVIADHVSLWLLSGWMTSITRTSISAYVHTDASGIFLCALGALSAFLITMKGYPREAAIKIKGKDDRISDDLLFNIAGYALLGVAIFPTAHTDHLCSFRDFRTAACSVDHLHFVSAFVFFAAVLYVVLDRFPRSGKHETENEEQRAKIKRKRLCIVVYRGCGAVMTISVAFLILNLCSPLSSVDKTWTIKLFFLFEAFVVMGFGLAWFTKAFEDAPFKTMNEFLRDLLGWRRKDRHGDAPPAQPSLES